MFALMPPEEGSLQGEPLSGVKLGLRRHRCGPLASCRGRLLRYPVRLRGPGAAQPPLGAAGGCAGKVLEPKRKK
jgi:hypothetical protein